MPLTFINNKNVYILIRLLTGPKSGSLEASFVGAPKESIFGKVFRNNMDKDSINSDIQKMINLAISNSKTTLYISEQLIKNSEEYKNCQVIKTYFPPPY